MNPRARIPELSVGVPLREAITAAGPSLLSSSGGFEALTLDLAEGEPHVVVVDFTLSVNPSSSGPETDTTPSTDSDSDADQTCSSYPRSCEPIGCF